MQDEVKSASGGEKDKDRLAKAIENMAKSQDKTASVWWTFLRGIFYGLGFFIGSAILAAAVIYILSKLEGWGSMGGFIQNIVNSASKTKS